jgi:hypothetical protein
MSFFATIIQNTNTVVPKGFFADLQAKADAQAKAVADQKAIDQQMVQIKDNLLDPNGVQTLETASKYKVYIYAGFALAAVGAVVYLTTRKKKKKD